PTEIGVPRDHAFRTLGLEFLRSVWLSSLKPETKTQTFIELAARLAWQGWFVMDERDRASARLKSALAERRWLRAAALAIPYICLYPSVVMNRRSWQKLL